jgi:hypothetical protein
VVTQSESESEEEDAVLSDDLMDAALIWTELHRINKMLIKSHTANMLHQVELQRVNRECLVMQHKMNMLFPTIEEFSKHSDSSTILSLASKLNDIRSLGEVETQTTPPKPKTVVFARDIEENAMHQCPDLPRPKQSRGNHKKQPLSLVAATVTPQLHEPPRNQGSQLSLTSDEANNGWVSPTCKHVAWITSPP